MWMRRPGKKTLRFARLWLCLSMLGGVFSQAHAQTAVLPGVNDVNWTAGVAVSRVLPQALNVPASNHHLVQYKVTGSNRMNLSDLPGMAFDAATRTLSGVPTRATLIQLTYSAKSNVAPSFDLEITFIARISRAIGVLGDNDTYRYINGFPRNITMPPASGGGSPTYSFSGVGKSFAQAAPGLSFNPATRVLSGSPPASGTPAGGNTRLQYRVTNPFGGNRVSRNFWARSRGNNNELTLPTVSDSTWVAKRQNPDITLPAASGGRAGQTTLYSLTGPNATPSDPDLPPAMTFDPATRVLSGRALVSAVTTLTYSATDNRFNATSTTFDVTVERYLPPVGTLYFVSEHPRQVQLPGATGEGKPAYGLYGGLNAADLHVLVPGLSFDNNRASRNITGAAKSTGTYTLTYRVSDGVSSTSRIVTVVVGNNSSALLSINAGPERRRMTVGQTESFTMPAANTSSINQNLILHYNLTGPNPTALDRDLPPGVSFDPATRVLSGTPPIAGSYPLTYSISDHRYIGALDTFAIDISRVMPPLANPTLNYVVNHSQISLTLPQATGGGPAPTYLLQNGTTFVDASTPLPGLAFNAATRVISGVPSTVGSQAFAYFAYDIHSVTLSVFTSFTIVVRTPKQHLSLIASSTYAYTANRPMADVTLPAATGHGSSGSLTYSLRGPDAEVGEDDPALPADLSFNPATRAISGRLLAAGAAVVTYRVDDDLSPGAQSIFKLQAGRYLRPIATQNYPQGFARPLILPGATGLGEPTYSLTGSGGQRVSAAAPGFNFNPSRSSRALFGAPTTVGTTSLTYQVDDDGDNAVTQVFDVVVHATDAGDLGLAALPTAPTRWLAGRDNVLVMPLPSGNNAGDSDLIYRVTGPNATFDDADLPSWLTFDPVRRWLEGSPPTVARAFTLTYSVSDYEHVGASRTFSIEVARYLAPVPDQLHIIGYSPAFNLTLPQATGTGSTTHILRRASNNSFVIKTISPGLSYDEDTRVISGTPTASFTESFTYSAQELGFPTSTRRTFSITIRTAGQYLTLPAVTSPYVVAATYDGSRTFAEAIGYASQSGAVTYRMTGPDATDSDVKLPAGVSFNPSNRVLNFAQADIRAGTTRLTYSVHDGLSPGAELTFSMRINIVLPEVNDLEFYGDVPQAVRLPGGIGGGSPIYTLLDNQGRTVSQILPGLTFNAARSSRVLYGKPPFRDGDRDLIDFVYRVDASAYGGGVAQHTFQIAVESIRNSWWVFPEVDSQGWPAGGGLRSVTLPEGRYEFAGIEPSPPVSYTLDSENAIDEFDFNLPDDFSFNPATRVFSGTPTTTGRYRLTYYALTKHYCAACGRERLQSAAREFTLVITRDIEPLDDIHYVSGIPQHITMPPANGGGDLLHRIGRVSNGRFEFLSTVLPGLVFDGATRLISGASSNVGSHELTYNGWDPNMERPLTAIEVFNIVVHANDASAIDLPNVNDVTWLAERTNAPHTFPAATASSTASADQITYALYGDVPTADNRFRLPDGLVFDPATRVLSGATAASSQVLLTYYVSDHRTGGASVTLTFTADRYLPPFIPLNAPQHNYVVGFSHPLTLPVATGGGSPVYALSIAGGIDWRNEFPGLEFDPDTRVIYGIPTSTAAANITYTATDAGRTPAMAQVTLNVAANDEAALTLPPPNVPTWLAGVANTPYTLPAATGAASGDLTYALRGADALASEAALPPGMAFDAATRVLSGTPPGAASVSLTYTATDHLSAGAQQIFTFTIARALADSAHSFVAGFHQALTLPAATGGGSPVYTLTGSAGQALSALLPGLAFDAKRRILHGTAATPTASSVALRYTAVDGVNSPVTASVRVVVNAAVAGALNLPPLAAATWPAASPQSRVLPLATGSAAQSGLAYDLRGANATRTDRDLPPGLAFNPASRILSGTPNTPAAAVLLTYTATDQVSAGARRILTLQVNRSLPAVAAHTQVVGFPRPLVLPIASGGGDPAYTLTGPASQDLSAALPGLSFDPSRRLMHGTPTAIASAMLTYTVVDPFGITATTTFAVAIGANSAAFNLPGPSHSHINVWAAGAYNSVLLSMVTGPSPGALSYSLSGPEGSTAVNAGLPPGLAFNPANLRLQGTPTTADEITLTYRATNHLNVGAEVVFNFVIGRLLPAIPAQTYIEGIPIGFVAFPGATGGGGGAPRYFIRGPNGQDISSAVSGLRFDSATRILSGAPRDPLTITLAYVVTDSFGNRTESDINITVNIHDMDAVDLPTPPDVAFALRRPNPAVTLPAATGSGAAADAELVYGLAGPNHTAGDLDLPPA